MLSSLMHGQSFCYFFQLKALSSKKPFMNKWIGTTKCKNFFIKNQETIVDFLFQQKLKSAAFFLFVENIYKTAFY